MASLLAEDYVITMEDGSTYGKTGFISYNAVVPGTYHERGAVGGKPYDDHDRLTDVWMKTGGRWQLIASHYSLPANP